MEKNILGRTGLKVTVAGLGGGGFSRLGMFTKGIDNAVGVIKSAYDQGVNFFDTAYLYGTQPAFAKALDGIPRDSYVLSSKFPYNNIETRVIKPASELEKNLDECLTELNTDHIDIFHIHGVTPEDYPIVRERFYPELVKMQEKGKIRFTGFTELFGGDTTHEAIKAALKDDVWDVIMVGYNMLNPSAAKMILPITMKNNVGTLCMFAVRSSLSNPEQLKLDVQKMYAANQVDRELVPMEHTLDFLIEGGHASSIMEAAYRFCRHTPGIDVTLTGTSSVDHLTDNLQSITMSPLPDSVLERLELMFGRVDSVSGQQDFPGKS